jgi:hypothetical protein
MSAARNFKIEADLGTTGQQFPTLLSILYVGCTSCSVPASLPRLPLTLTLRSNTLDIIMQVRTQDPFVKGPGVGIISYSMLLLLL